ncbi:hypothetical protein ACLGI4_09525 [Streptomyces sp. HMX112]|uniref:hypothetical protein n=1 Tax=Streptomyces sp. HMX112 TaxID=3390850 RepID=UPI003A7FE986
MADGILEPAGRRDPADPVKTLLHLHRDLCERAVDPLEIAAGLEAHGLTDRTAARFRHRDVFGLAEELYARVPRGGTGHPRTTADPDTTAADPDAADPDTNAAAPAGTAVRAAGRALLPLLPGAVCALTLGGLAAAEGRARLALGALGAVVCAVALVAALRRGPLRATGRPVPGTGACAGWLLAYAAFGDGLLIRLLTGGPDGPRPPDPGALLGLALAVAPAVWCASLFATGAHRGLAGSRGLRDFTARTRPLLLGVVALYLTALAGALVAARLMAARLAPAPDPGAGPAGVPDPGAAGPGAAPFVAVTALGALLFLARLLSAHGRPEAAATALLTACAAEALALASVLAARLPGCDVLARPVGAVTEAGGAAAVPALVCGVAALALLARATAVLTRASTHATVRPTG